jgi:hypothetical protein
MPERADFLRSGMNAAHDVLPNFIESPNYHFML